MATQPVKPNAKNPAGGAQASSTEKAGVGTKSHPENVRVPEDVLIKRPDTTEEGTKVTTSPEVQGNKALLIIDILNSRPVHVSLVEGLALLPDQDGRLVFIEGPVAYDLKSVDRARALFAVKKDGTVIYNPRGFDDVASGDFDMLDIVKLIDYNHSSEGKAAAKKADDAARKASDDESKAAAAEAKKKAKEDEKAKEDDEK